MCPSLSSLSSFDYKLLNNNKNCRGLTQPYTLLRQWQRQSKFLKISFLRKKMLYKTVSIIYFMAHREKI